MQKEIFNRIICDPDILGGKPVIKGTRIAVEFLLELLANNWTHEEIIENYPAISKEDIFAALEYSLSPMKKDDICMIPYQKELTEYFSTKDSIILAYLFGSTVRGDTGRLSDIDIGVMMDEKLSKKDRFDLELKIISEIAILIKKNKIDLIVLNEAPLLLIYNIIKNGIILKSNEIQRVKFETKIISTYIDQKYYINRFTEKTLKRIAEVGFA